MRLFKQFADQNCVAVTDAATTGNGELVALNIGHAIKSRLMQGMIAWRSQLANPGQIFQQALAFTKESISKCSSVNSSEAVLNNHLGLSKANFMAFLVGIERIPDRIVGLEADVLLDGVLANSLFDQWDSEAWSRGIDRLRKLQGTELAVRSYQTYLDILNSNNPETTRKHVIVAIDNYGKRKSNAFFSGGNQTDGGGLDNAYVVDYRLAAVMKRVEHKSNTMHDWLWDR